LKEKEEYSKEEVVILLLGKTKKLKSERGGVQKKGREAYGFEGPNWEMSRQRHRV